MQKMFALVDCNSFYVSCERVFNPALNNKPVVVLSNNDGCAISRSQEAKNIGIAMGAPIFKCEQLVNRYDVKVCSANFVLYGDMSARVMSVLSLLAPKLSVYSIDEAFLSLEGFNNVTAYGRKIKKVVKAQTGIPVSVGIAPTKTLAKLANHIAKDNHIFQGVFSLIDTQDIDQWLEKTDVQEIWGIGYEKALFLNRHGIYNALQLKNVPDNWVKKHLTVMTLRTVMELRGIPSISSEEIQPAKKAIVTSRTFGYEVTQLAEMQEAIASYVANAAEKLRMQNQVAGYMQVFIQTSPFKEGYYRNGASIDITPPTAYTPQLITTANGLLSGIYKEGYRYKSVGVLLTHFSDEECVQQDLFKPVYAESTKQRLMKVIDTYNHKSNAGQLFFASEGLGKSWYMKQSHKSKRFTTRWDELLEIVI